MIATSCSARSSIALDPAFFVAAQNLLRAVLSSDVTKPELRSFLLALQLIEDPQGCVPFRLSISWGCCNAGAAPWQAFDFATTTYLSTRLLRDIKTKEII
jgi:hypothetical protein